MKKQVLALFFILIAFTSQAQLTVGGNIGGNFDGGSNFEISPVIGYRLAILEIGVAPFYSSTKPDGATESITTYGGRIYSQVSLIQGIFLHAEISGSNSGVSGARSWYLQAPMGGGYEYKMGNMRFQGMITWDLFLDKNSGAKNPTYRAGVKYDL